MNACNFKSYALKTEVTWYTLSSSACILTISVPYPEASVRIALSTSNTMARQMQYINNLEEKCKINPDIKRLDARKIGNSSLFGQFLLMTNDTKPSM